MIYGATGGIGSETARLLQQRGFQLHLTGRDEAALTALAQELGATSTVGDVTQSGFCSQVAQEAGEVLAGLVYGVGTIHLKPLPRFSETDFLRDFQVNALGAALAVQAALPALRKNPEPASVVFFSSVAVSQGFAFHASIGMAKGAVEGLTRSLAAELAPKIRVNAIAPSLTRTKLAAGILANEQTATAIAGLHPLQRLGTAADMAGLVAFLLGSEAGWMTGQVIGVDGGRSTLRTKG